MYVCVLNMYLVHIFCYIRMRTDTTVNQLLYNLLSDLFLALRDKRQWSAFPQFSFLSLPFASFSSYTDSVQHRYLQRNPWCISLHQEGYLLPTASHPQEVADSSFPRRKGKERPRINYPSAKCRKQIFHYTFIISQHSKSLTSCTLNGKPGTLF